MHCLLTNDDGIDAPGLWVAARALAELGTVLVVAPSRDWSGYGAALPPAREVSYRVYPTGPDLRGVAAFALMASPATCTAVGLSGALSNRHVDFVVSGINDSLNLGHDVFFSGTVGAALTAHLAGVPALAASLESGNASVRHWDTAAWAIQELVRSSTDHHAAAATLFNVNVPDRHLSDLAGIQMTWLAGGSTLARCQARATSDNTLVFSVEEATCSEAAEAGSDCWAVERGYISITPLRVASGQQHLLVCGDVTGPVALSIAHPKLLSRAA